MNPAPDNQEENLKLQQTNRKLAWRLGIFSAGFLAFGFALVPLYDVLCEVTGYGNRRNLMEATSLPVNGEASNREITVEFMSTMPSFGEWEFRPVQSSVKVRTGQLVAAQFVAKNLLAKPATGQAVPSLSPNEASQYFRKTECFCFTPQQFAAGEERELIVRFVVDPQLPPNLDRITLAYSMFGATEKVASAN